MSEFHRLIEQQIPRLRRYARALTRNGERGDDLVQDTLVRTLAKEHLWQPGTNLRPWLFTIMHNQNVNVVRSSLREGAAASLDELSGSLVATTTDPIARRQLRELEDAFDELPEEQRQVILLIGLEGMNYAEAAQVVGVPIGTIRSHSGAGADDRGRRLFAGRAAIDRCAVAGVPDRRRSISRFI